MSDEKAVVRSDSLNLKQVVDRVNLVHQVLDKVMKKGTHYGTVPGCGAKMVLLKPGADVLAMTFRLVPQFNVTRTDLADGHREYDVTCSMYGPSGELLGQGVGSASTMEKKYRYRRDESGKKAENEDIADVYNTVLKIAKKRAHIDATLTVTGAADLFTQDLIDEDEPVRAPVKMPVVSEPKPVEPDPEGTREATGEVEIVSVKEGASAKGPWKKYGVRMGDNWYATFDSSVGQQAESLQGQQVRIVYTTNAKGYHDIVSLTAAEAKATAEAPVARTPEPPSTDRDALIAEIGPMVAAAKASKLKSAMAGCGIAWDQGESWEQADTGKLVALRSVLKC